MRPPPNPTPPAQVDDRLSPACTPEEGPVQLPQLLPERVGGSGHLARLDRQEGKAAQDGHAAERTERRVCRSRCGCRHAQPASARCTHARQTLHPRAPQRRRASGEGKGFDPAGVPRGHHMEVLETAEIILISQRTEKRVGALSAPPLARPAAAGVIKGNMDHFPFWAVVQK
eukprot:scaffold89935_cov29-Tisochrysis_lutea.AAC.5